MGVPIREWYARVNSVWMGPLPVLTEPEARTAAKRLWRWATGNVLPYRIDFTSGRRYTWERRGTLYINAGKGWSDFVHLMSHLAWRKTNGAAVRGHERGHAQLELRMRREVQKRGWLDGSMRREEADEPAPSVAPLEAAREARAIQAQKREARVRAAFELAEKRLLSQQRRLSILRAKVRYYDRKKDAHV